MTVPELIAGVLDNLKRNFYTSEMGFALREFKRDERQLIKAIATYGYECNQRGWQFQADFIYQELSQLLLKIRTGGAEVEYLPVYLAGAIRRHIGLRADELNAKAKALPVVIGKAVTDLGKLQRFDPATHRAPSDVEIFAEVYRGLAKIQRDRKRKKKTAAKETQESLL